MINFLTSSQTEERIAQNIYIRNSNRNFKRINCNNNNNINLEMYKLIAVIVITLLQVADLSPGICGRFFAW